MADETVTTGNGEDAGQSAAGEDKSGQGAAASTTAKTDAGNADQGADAVPTRGSKPWRNREERATFFKGRQSAKQESSEDAQDDFSDIEDESQRQFAQRLVSSLEKRFTPKFEELSTRQQQERDNYEISQFLGKPENERFRKYEAQARKYLSHPAYANVDIGLVFQGIAFNDAEFLGAEKGKKTETKIKQQSVGGTTRRTEPPQKDPLKMSSKEFKEYKKGLAGKLPTEE